jgi:hypothetical protein
MVNRAPVAIKAIANAILDCPDIMLPLDLPAPRPTTRSISRFTAWKRAMIAA